MADTTKIEWADRTLNFWIGCTQVSSACDNCYAMSMARRLKIKWNAAPVLNSNRQWDRVDAYQRGAKRFFQRHGRRQLVFVNSMSDFFDKRAQQIWRAAAFMKIERAPDVNWLLVTKRPQNILKMVPLHWLQPGGWPENVWLGVTVENQEEANRRIPLLLAVPGVKVRFISCEPLLGPLDLGAVCEQTPSPVGYDALRGRQFHYDDEGQWTSCPKLDWVICGGESGANARPMHPDWARALRNQCAAADVPFFFKQWGTWQPFEPGDIDPDKWRIVWPNGMLDTPDLTGRVYDDCAAVRRVGKKAAGRILDGMTYDGKPV